MQIFSEEAALTEMKPAVAKRESVDPEPEIYHYIIPAGLNVVFQDEDGKEITRYYVFIQQWRISAFKVKTTQSRQEWYF